MDPVAAPSVIEWHGPFTQLDSARNAVQENIAGVKDARVGIYMAIGRPTRGILSRILWRFAREQMSYVGIGILKNRLDEDRSTLSDIAGLKMWIGWLKSMPSPDERWEGRKHDPKLDDAEWAIAYFLNPALNQKKTVNPPHRPILVQSRWVSNGAATVSPHKDWPDILAWPVLPQKRSTTSVLPLDLRGLGKAAMVWLAPRQEVRITERA